LAALLQDIGVLVLAKAFPEIYAEVTREARGNHAQLRKLEEKRFGVDHAEMGVWLAAISQELAKRAVLYGISRFE
jgi:HD-like signal output (HDOD) protein